MVSKAIKKRLISPIFQRFAKYYFRKARKYNFKHIQGVVLPGVFPPHFTISTKLLMEFIEEIDLQNKKFLELGCGTGLISVLAAQNKAQVFASDINPKAIENAELNAKKNNVQIETILSDLFENIPIQTFNYIIINPPYYPKKPNNLEEQAWFCGEEFNYFKKLFSTMSPYFNTDSMVYMILSEDCQVDAIQEIANQNQLKLERIKEIKKAGEKNYIFQITVSANQIK